jgi:hypothetical protein
VSLEMLVWHEFLKGGLLSTQSCNADAGVSGAPDGCTRARETPFSDLIRIASAGLLTVLLSKEQECTANRDRSHTGPDWNVDCLLVLNR